jgi:hypothetical protein
MGGVLVFAATFIAYARGHADAARPGYMPLILGSICFGILVGLFTYRLSHSPGVWWKSFAVGLVAAMVFAASLLFVLVSAFGS